jgi:hypothetical protein
VVGVADLLDGDDAPIEIELVAERPNGERETTDRRVRNDRTASKRRPNGDRRPND